MRNFKLKEKTRDSSKITKTEGEKINFRGAVSLPVFPSGVLKKPALVNEHFADMSFLDLQSYETFIPHWQCNL